MNKERWIEGRGIELISLERLAILLKAKIPLEMLRSPTQARKVTAARRQFVLGAVKMGSPTVVDCCFPPLLTVGHFKDHSAELLSAITR